VKRCECNVNRVGRRCEIITIHEFESKNCQSIGATWNFSRREQPENMLANLYLSNLKLYLLIIQVFRIEEYVLKIVLIFSVFPLNLKFFPQKILGVGAGAGFLLPSSWCSCA
jgi:hypothetical protein